MTNPHYPHIVLAFNYRDHYIEIDQDTFEGRKIYAVWINHQLGCCLAVPYVENKIKAIRKAKSWIDARFGSQHMEIE